jgi:hypothetical protein
MITKAVMKSNTLILHENINIPDGEEVEVIVKRLHIIDEMYGALKIADSSIIDELLESVYLE